VTSLSLGLFLGAFAENNKEPEGRMMEFYPTQLELRDGVLLRITWSDGKTREYPVKVLREACPCATCREKRNESLSPNPPPAGTGFSLPVLPLAEARPLTIQAMQPVGSYA
jgi:hypothetical protein